MTEPDTTPRRGRRARALSPEESAALESRSAVAATDDQAPAPGVRGAVAPPDAAAPVPTLRKFGRRARIIELSEEPEQAAQSAAGSADPAASADVAASAGTAASDATGGGSTEPRVAPQQEAGSVSASHSQSSSQTIVIDRDADGVELGELSVTEAPAPRPAPRFEGTVLHRAEGAGSRSLLWLVWALVAIALVVLIALLLTGVLGPGEASALDASVQHLFIDHLVLKESAA